MLTPETATKLRVPLKLAAALRTAAGQGPPKAATPKGEGAPKSRRGTGGSEMRRQESGGSEMTSSGCFRGASPPQSPRSARGSLQNKSQREDHAANSQQTFNQNFMPQPLVSTGSSGAMWGGTQQSSQMWGTQQSHMLGTQQSMVSSPLSHVLALQGYQGQTLSPVPSNGQLPSGYPERQASQPSLANYQHQPQSSRARSPPMYNAQQPSAANTSSWSTPRGSVRNGR